MWHGYLNAITFYNPENISDCQPILTAMAEIGLGDAVLESEPVDNPRYQELLGSLLFLATRTRPDICAAVSILSRYSSYFTRMHGCMLKRVLRYLKGSLEFALRFLMRDYPTLEGYCDVDWAGDCTDRKSTSSILLQHGRSTVSWRSLKRKTVPLSTTEAEFLSVCEGAKIILWLRTLLKEIACPQNYPTNVWGDNQGAAVWGVEGVRDSKHVSIRSNFIKKQVDNSVLKLQYCATHEMRAEHPNETSI